MLTDAQEKRLIKRVAITGFCWLWQGKLQEGYGSINVEGKTLRAHRWVYSILVGEVAPELDLDHLCRVRNCVNPDHLEPVTRAENLRRSHNIGKGDPWKHRRAYTAAGFKICVNGHTMDTANIYHEKPNKRTPAGRQVCLICHRAASERARRKRGVPLRASGPRSKRPPGMPIAEWLVEKQRRRTEAEPIAA